MAIITHEEVAIKIPGTCKRAKPKQAEQTAHVITAMPTSSQHHCQNDNSSHLQHLNCKTTSTRTGCDTSLHRCATWQLIAQTTHAGTSIAPSGINYSHVPGKNDPVRSTVHYHKPSRLIVREPMQPHPEEHLHLRLHRARSVVLTSQE